MSKFHLIVWMVRVTKLWLLQVIFLNPLLKIMINASVLAKYKIIKKNHWLKMAFIGCASRNYLFPDSFFLTVEFNEDGCQKLS